MQITTDKRAVGQAVQVDAVASGTQERLSVR